jgi:hypothetical protein
MSILIIRAFVKMRELLASHKDLAARVEKLEAAQEKHGSIIGILAEEIDEMKSLPEPPKRRIGFKTNSQTLLDLSLLRKLLTPTGSGAKMQSQVWEFKSSKRPRRPRLHAGGDDIEPDQIRGGAS